MTYDDPRALVGLLESDFATAVDALDHHAVHRAGHVAIHYGETGEDVTYLQFAERTDRIAGNLRSLGVAPGDRVSVLTTAPLAATLLMYGIWKAGAVYAPVNFQYAGDLLAYQLADTGPRMLVVDAALRPTVDAIADRLPDIATVVIDGSADDGTTFEDLLAPAARPDHQVGYDDAANVIYTSGTTGPSKGVVQSHRWINGYTWVGRRAMNQDDVVYNDLPLYHVGGAHFNVAKALWVGATVSLWNRFSPQDFWRRVTTTGCTTAVLLDVMTPWLLKAEPRDDDRRNPLKLVHMQPLPAEHHEFARRFGIDFTTSGFGQSESGASLMTLIEQTAEGEGTPADLYRGKSHAELRQGFLDHGLLVVDGADALPHGIMGRPAPFVDVAVLDEHDMPCAPGQVGELAMRPKVPDLLFAEYLAKPAATVKAWRNLWFHTGDAAMIDDNGLFVYVDRLGDRIRVRGENISSFHVEELLAKHPAVQLAAVVAVAGAEGDEDDIAAFVEIAPGAAFDEQELRRHCEQVMPKFMRPRHLVAVDQIPRTPTNKIEKYKLRQHLLEGSTS
ncbi:ATP-dependent acyl-CoA ligase [Nocardioides albidus]|uniref:ATP-dependent acyl-CoA ligase n=1 Tax=Nocardioides albidus TaxID=1517589 RepID=A0A5C4VKF7_9ACTN|nr:AMP-binding protein [Nocardioides albidus]TNM36360.1 ATP-dependent acyl-CoA ligase [Nocardioides albidus]